MMFFNPANSIAARCSRVWGCGQGSLAAIMSSAPSMTVAPESIVAMRASCPGESTKLTALTNLHSEPQLGHVESEE